MVKEYDLETRQMLLKRSGNCCEICKVHNDIGPHADPKRGRRLFAVEGPEGPMVVCGECKAEASEPKQMELFT